MLLWNKQTLSALFNMLCASNLYIMQMSEFFSLALNFCYCLEIIENLRDPFYPANRRMKFYIGGSVLFAACIPPFTLGRGMNDYNNATSGKFLETQALRRKSTRVRAHLYVVPGIFVV